MKNYEFSNSQQIYNFLLENGDLYNPVLEIYLWEYNNNGAIAYANLTQNEAISIAEEMAKDNEYWGADLGGRSYIVEAEDADKYKDESPELFEANEKAVLEYLDQLLKENSKEWYKADASYLDNNIKKILLNNSNECELLIAKDNYALLRRNTCFGPYVIAYKPKIQLGTIEWEHGHYFNEYKNAVQIFNKKSNINETNRLVVIKLGKEKYVQSVNNTENLNPSKLFNLTDNLKEAKLFFHDGAYNVVPDNWKWCRENNLKICNLQREIENQTNLQSKKSEPKAKLASRSKPDNSNTFHR